MRELTLSERHTLIEHGFEWALVMLDDAKLEVDAWHLAFAHAIMKSPEEAFAYVIDGKSIETRAKEWLYANYSPLPTSPEPDPKWPDSGSGGTGSK